MRQRKRCGRAMALPRPLSSCRAVAGGDSWPRPGKTRRPRRWASPLPFREGRTLIVQGGPTSTPALFASHRPMEAIDQMATDHITESAALNTELLYRQIYQQIAADIANG